jgi:NADPH-dependent 2,4-dienoyl-CoA reductase/sulfur reductase-like enzyme
MNYRYLIVGGGLTGDSAIEGIRAHDQDGSILMVTRENHLPYHRPPLSKDLWFGKKKKD